MEIHTMSGFVCNVNEKKAQDWRFAKALADWDSKDESRIMSGMTFAVPFLLGEEQEALLMEHIMDEEGVVSTEVVLSEFKEIVTLMGIETKKSQASQA
ncbi:MAG: hypothetical protein J6S67_04375 [Methanobrevibacter sp.]|nr:hypothetical protein [Methanobrevibacter sp.]